MDAGISAQPAPALDVRRPAGVAARRRLSGTTLVGIAVVAGIAAFALGAWAFVSTARNSDSRESSADFAALLDRSTALLANPTTERIKLTGSKGRLVLAVGADGRAILVIRGLSPAPAGRAYEAWLIPRGGTPARAAVFSGGRRVVELHGDVAHGTVVAVSLERAGGTARPTRTPKLVALRP